LIVFMKMPADANLKTFLAFIDAAESVADEK
jgi:hypothetical protein